LRESGNIADAESVGAGLSVCRGQDQRRGSPRKPGNADLRKRARQQQTRADGQRGNGCAEEFVGPDFSTA